MENRRERLTVGIEGTTMVIRIPMTSYLARSGKSTVIATTGGSVKTEYMANGTPLVLNVCATIKNGKN
jgi:hypothetical protein